jgi:hypothetical protein
LTIKQKTFFSSICDSFSFFISLIQRSFFFVFFLVINVKYSSILMIFFQCIIFKNKRVFFLSNFLSRLFFNRICFLQCFVTFFFLSQCVWICVLLLPKIKIDAFVHIEHYLKEKWRTTSCVLIFFSLTCVFLIYCSKIFVFFDW